eukprot:7497055-Karenia_brevis.AAC.1
MSALEFSKFTDYHLSEYHSKDVYRHIGTAFGYKPLGSAPPEQIAALRHEPGTMTERRWERVDWNEPVSEVEPCQ